MAKSAVAKSAALGFSQRFAAKTIPNRPNSEPTNAGNRKANSLGPNTEIESLTKSKYPNGAAWLRSSGRINSASDFSWMFNANIASSIQSGRS